MSTRIEAIRSVDRVSEEIAGQGFAILTSLIPHALIESLIIECTAMRILDPGAPKNWIEKFWRLCPTIARVTSLVRPFLEHELSFQPLITQAVLLDKTKSENWSMPLHRDRFVYIAGDTDALPWTTRLRAPNRILRRMLIARVHLDDSPPTSGNLRVIAGTHLVPQRSPRLQQGVVTLNLRRGDVLLMKPLIMHESPPSTLARPRRVVHLTFVPRVFHTAIAWQQSFNPWLSQTLPPQRC